MSSVCQNGVAFVAAMALKARPMIPETLPVTILAVVWTTVNHVCPGTVKPPILTVSCAKFPATVPLPYRTVTDDEVVCSVLDFVTSNKVVPAHVVHCEEASQKSAEPVSIITLKDCGGVPTLTDVK